MEERNQRGIVGRKERDFVRIDAILNGLYEDSDGKIQIMQIAWFYAIDNNNPYLGWRGVDWIKLSLEDKRLLINTLIIYPEIFGNAFTFLQIHNLNLDDSVFYWGDGIPDIGGGAIDIRHLASMIRIFLKAEKIDFQDLEGKLGIWRNHLGDGIECLYEEIE